MGLLRSPISDRAAVTRTRSWLLDVIDWSATRIASIGLALAAAALLFVVAVNAANIIGRYVFRSPFPWAEESMLFVMIFGVYIGAISVAWQQAHIRIDAFVNLAPPFWQRALHIFSTLVLVGILVPVVLASYRVVTLLFEFDQRSDALQFPMWIPQGIVPVSLTLIMLLALARLLDPRAPAASPDEHGYD
jgi:TRAP-type C4-dicarboxylate transport system permease small subunit